MHNDPFMCFIVYRKVTVKDEDLLAILSRLNIGRKDLKIKRNIYSEQTSAVQVENELTDYMKINRGVRQACIMSPALFSLCAEIII